MRARDSGRQDNGWGVSPRTEKSEQPSPSLAGDSGVVSADARFTGSYIIEQLQ
jgi:hypothetical protein